MKLKEKTIFDITVGDAVKIIVIFKISRFTYKVFDGVAQKLYERNEEGFKNWIDKTSDKASDKITETVFPEASQE